MKIWPERDGEGEGEEGLMFEWREEEGGNWEVKSPPFMEAIGNQGLRRGAALENQPLA